MKSKSSFQFHDYIITKSLIVREPIRSQEDFNIDINPSGIYNTDEEKFQLSLEVKISNEKDSTLIQIEAIGFFSFSGDKKMLKDFLFLNAPAILFPYIRAYVSSLTALSGLDTITLPTMNLQHLKEKLDANTKFISNSELEN